MWHANENIFIQTDWVSLIWALEMRVYFGATLHTSTIEPNQRNRKSSNSNNNSEKWIETKKCTQRYNVKNDINFVYDAGYACIAPLKIIRTNQLCGVIHFGQMRIQKKNW